jgi:hypothetical protein
MTAGAEPTPVARAKAIANETGHTSGRLTLDFRWATAGIRFRLSCDVVDDTATSGTLCSAYAARSVRVDTAGGGRVSVSPWA